MGQSAGRRSCVCGFQQKKQGRMGQSAGRLRRERPTWTMSTRLGAGSYGAVHKVTRGGQVAAAKIATIQKEGELATFQSEVSILVACQNPNITNFIDGYYFENTVWIIIELCTGGSLSDVLSLRKPRGLEEPQIQCIAFQLLRGIEFLHSKFVIHRDINASNILLSEGGLIKLADFGVSMKCKGEPRRSSFIGSPHWMAPEVVACEQSKKNTYGTSCDIWSLGVTLLELADGRAPNSDLHPMKVLFKIASAPPPTLVAPDAWSPMFNEFLRNALVKDPTARPTATALLPHPFVRGHSAVEPLVALHRAVVAQRANSA
eukprot:m.234613 g.234613  ORF g.234613 m.234613 type:complete len:317 (+) comp19691_c0_seq1:2-952(+)